MTQRLQARVLQLTTFVYHVQLWDTFTWVQGNVQRALASSLKPWKRHSLVTRNEVLSCWWVRVWYQIQNSCCTTCLTWFVVWCTTGRSLFAGLCENETKQRLTQGSEGLVSLPEWSPNTLTLSPCLHNQPSRTKYDNVISPIYSASYMWVWHFKGTPSTVAKRPAKLFGVCLLDMWTFDCLLSKQRNQHATFVVRDTTWCGLVAVRCTECVETTNVRGGQEAQDLHTVQRPIFSNCILAHQKCWW